MLTIVTSGSAAARTAPPRGALSPCRRAQVMGSCWLLACAGATAAETDFGTQAMALVQTQAGATSLEMTADTYPTLSDPVLQSLQRGNAVQQIGVTQWISPDRPHSMGLSLGVATPSGAIPFPSATALPAPIGIDLGVRWRSRLTGGRQLDVSAWARAPQNTPATDAMGLIWSAQQPTYGTRVEMQWASSRTGGIVPEFGAIGMQLQSGSRVVLRAKRGGPMLYYRAKF